MLSPVSVAMFFHKRGYGVVMGLSLLCSRRVAYEGSASCSSMFQSPFYACMMGMRWMDTRQLVAYNHMFINLQSCCLVMLRCPDWCVVTSMLLTFPPHSVQYTFFSHNSTEPFHLLLMPTSTRRPSQAQTFRLTFLLFLLAPSNLFAIFGISISSTPSGMTPSSSSNTCWIIARMSCSSSSVNRVPAYIHVSNHPYHNTKSQDLEK